MRAAVYCRISLDADGEGLGVQRQEQDCRAEVERRGWSLVEVYVDNSVSAANTRKARPAYQRMRADWKAGRFDAIVAYSTDRLTRTLAELEEWVTYADQGLALVTIRDDIDLTTGTGKLIARIMASVARNEIDTHSERRKRALKQRAEQGKPWGGQRPFGFEKDGTTHRPDEADVVRTVFNDFIAGVSQHEIARRLNTRGIPTSTGGTWSQPKVQQLLKRGRVAGLREYHRKIIGQGTWEPIVSEGTFYAAQSMMGNKPGMKPGGPGKYLLTGVIRCGVCGRGLTTGWITYSSGTRVRQYKCGPTGHIGRRADRIEDAVTEYVLAYLETKGAAALITPTDQTEADELSAQADQLRRRQDLLATEFADGDLTASQLRTANERIRDRLQTVENRLASMRSHDVLSPMLNADDVRAVWESLDIPRRRTIIDTLLEITIKPASKGRTFNVRDIEFHHRR